MNGREVYEALYAGQRPDRLPLIGFGAWPQAIERWRREGLDSTDNINYVLGLPGDDVIGLPLNLNMVPEFPIRVLERDDDYVTCIDEFGVTKKMLTDEFDRSRGSKTGASATNTMSHWIDFPVKDMASWKGIYEQRFQPRLKDRLPENWDRAAFVEKSKTRWVSFFSFPLCGLFGPLREMMGLEGMIYAMHDQPQLIHTIIADLTDFWLKTFSQLLGEVRCDQVMFFEDMCATKAPLVSPAMFREFFAPGYRKTTDGLRQLGVQQFIIDTDGNAWDLLPEFLACGITGTSPCEAASGMDVARMREHYPTLALNGGINKRELTRTIDDVDREMARCFSVAWEKSRYTPQLDHGAPPDIPWANIQRYAERYREFCQHRP